MKWSFQIRLESMILGCAILLGQFGSFAQPSFEYQHWSDGEFTAQIIKEFSSSSAMPSVKIKHTRLGQSHISGHIDYRSDIGDKYRASIGYRVNGDNVTFYFLHCPETNVNDCREDNIINFRDVCTSKFQIKIEDCPLAILKSPNENINLRFSVLERGPNCPGRQGTITLPAPDQRNCPGVGVPAGWLIIDQVDCVGSCNDRAGSGCLIRVIRDLRNRPQGNIQKVCPGQTLPPGWTAIGTEPCIGTCAARAGSACVLNVIKKN